MKDLVFNYLKWKNENNILYITGNSGSGKSTLADKFIEEHKNVYYFNLDIFFTAAKLSKHEFIELLNSMYFPDELQNLLTDYFLNILTEEDFGYYKPPKMNYNKFTYLANLANAFVTLAEHQLKENYYIFESSVLYMRNPKFYVEKPIILLGASYWKSSWRGIKRAIKRRVPFKKFLQIFYNRILTMFSKKNSLYIQHFDYMNFREELIELMDVIH